MSFHMQNIALSHGWRRRHPEQDQEHAHLHGSQEEESIVHGEDNEERQSSAPRRSVSVKQVRETIRVSEGLCKQNAFCNSDVSFQAGFYFIKSPRGSPVVSKVLFCKEKVL